MRMRKKRVVSVHAWLPHYRIPFYERLAEMGNYDLHVVHGDSPGKPNAAFRETVLPVRHIGPMKFLVGLKEQLVDADAIIFLLDPGWSDGLWWALSGATPRACYWGIGPGRNWFMNCLRRYMVRNSPTLFYSEAGKNALRAKGSWQKVAPNTVLVSSCSRNSLDVGKRNVLCVGSLDARKRVDLTLREFSKAIRGLPSDVNLWIVGEGREGESLRNLASELGCKQRVKFMGEMVDPLMLRDAYESASISVSYGQAGLSVLQSLGHGVPFVTAIDSISGGESTNIVDGETGIRFENRPGKLAEILVTLFDDPRTLPAMQEASRTYYKNHRTMDHMVRPFMEAIDFICS